MEQSIPRGNSDHQYALTSKLCVFLIPMKLMRDRRELRTRDTAAGPAWRAGAPQRHQLTRAVPTGLSDLRPDEPVQLVRTRARWRAAAHRHSEAGTLRAGRLPHHRLCSQTFDAQRCSSQRTSGRACSRSPAPQIATKRRVLFSCISLPGPHAMNTLRSITR